MEQKKKNKFIGILTLILTIIVFLSIASTKENKHMSASKNVSESITAINSSNPKIYTSGENIFFFNNEKVSLVNTNKVVWEDFFSTSKPYSDFIGGKLGIAELNGKILKVYSEKGLLYTVNSISPINSFSINKNGYSATITKINNYYQIDAYTAVGEHFFSLKDISFSEGIPVSCSISPDNKTLAVSFLQIDGIKVNSNVVLYPLDTSIEEDPSIFAAFLIEKQFVGILKFIGNNYLLSISDKGAVIFKVSANNFSSTQWEMEFYNTLKFAKVVDEKTFVLVYGQPKTTLGETFKDNTVVFYNVGGEKLGQYTSEKDILGIETGFGSCIIKNNRLYTALNKNGSVIWQYQAIQDLNQLLFFENANQIIISSNNGVTATKINKKMVEEEATKEEKIESEVPATPADDKEGAVPEEGANPPKDGSAKEEKESAGDLQKETEQKADAET